MYHEGTILFSVDKYWNSEIINISQVNTLTATLNIAFSTEAIKRNFGNSESTTCSNQRWVTTVHKDL